MNQAAGKSSAEALETLLKARGRFTKLTDKDYAAATAVLVKKLMVSAGQTTDDMNRLRETVGSELFDTVLKSLTAHQARLLARRLDSSAPDLEVSTAGAACAWILSLLKEPEAEPETETETETANLSEETAPEDPTPENDPSTPGKSAYFGRKAFRTGG